jgi:hypothetical protein
VCKPSFSDHRSRIRGRTPTRELLRRRAYLTAVTGDPPAAATGEDLVTRRLKADAERLPLAGDAR